MDLVSSTASTSVSWGPYILLALGAIGVVTWYFIRRILAKLDDLTDKLGAVTGTVAVLMDRQSITARKVGVPASQLKDLDNA